MARKPPPSAKSVDYARLCAAYRASRRKMEHFRSTRRELAARIAGDQYSEETATQPRPVNCLSLYTRVVPRSVVPKEPRVSLSTMEAQYRPTVKAMERWVNDEFSREHLGDELRRVFLDALLCFGVMKVGLASPGDSVSRGYGLAAGKPFAERVDLEDFAFDPVARDLTRASWYAQRQRVRLDALKDSNLYEKAVQRKIEAQVYSPHNDQGDEKIGTIASQVETLDEAFDFAEVVEFYLPAEKLVVTMLADEAGNVYAGDLNGDNPPLDVREWVGPDCGPYHFLLLQVVPGNAPGKGPIQDIVTLDEHFNALFTKLIEEAGAAKEILAYQNSADKDAERITAAANLSAVRVDNLDKIKPITFGGPNPANQAFGLALWEFINKLGGNIEAMAGLGAQASTLGQERIINANSSATTADMQELTVELLARVSDALCWYYHYHPELVMETSWAPRSMPDNAVKTPVYPASHRGRPGDRVRNFPYEAIQCRCDPYSLSHQTPGGKLQFILQVVTQVLTPLAPLLQQDGTKIDTATLLQKLSELSGVAELAEVVKYAEPPTEQAGDASELPHDRTLPVATERTYNRVNPSEKTDSGQRTAMQQMLAAASAGRNGSAKAGAA